MCALAGIALGAMNHHDEPAELAVGVGFPITALAALLGSEQTRLRRIIVWSFMLLGLGLFALGAYLQSSAQQLIQSDAASRRGITQVSGAAEKYFGARNE